MTLCDGSQKEAKPLSGVLHVDGCSCLAPARISPHCWQSGCESQVWDCKGSLSTPSRPLGGDKFTQGCRCDRLLPTTPNKCLHTAYKESWVAIPTSKGPTICFAILLYRPRGYFYFRKTFSWNIWAIFFNPQCVTLCNTSTFWSKNKLKFGLNKLKICTIE